MNDDIVFQKVHNAIFEDKSRAEPHIVAWLMNCDWSAANRIRWSALCNRCPVCGEWMEEKEETMH